VSNQPPDPPKTGEIIPFGKYKGQPAEVLVGDPQYVAWLEAQGWFRAKFPGLHTLIVNNFAEPFETPEHNRLQARLLDRDFCFRLARIAVPGAVKRVLAKVLEVEQDELSYKERWRREALKNWYSDERRAEVNAEYDVAILPIKARISAIAAIKPDTPPHDCTLSHIEFEVAGWDAVVLLTFRVAHLSADFSVCLAVAKPALGDDYPAVLRQIKKHGVVQGRPWFSWNSSIYDHCRRVLLVRLTAVGATRAQIEAIFAASGIRLVMLAEEAVTDSPLDPGRTEAAP
jgi:hypothetical protein